LTNISSPKVAIVTGGGRGIGRAIAQALARTGAQVAVAARSQNELNETVQVIDDAGGRAMAVPADVSDGAAVRWLVHEVEEKFGAVDLLVNNAGVGEPLGPIADVDPDAWWRCLEINVRGPLLCTQAVLPGMLARGQGRIIHVASGAGTFAIPNLSAYAISKTALIRFSETLAIETRGAGVQSFSIAPGTVRTAMAESLLNHPRGEEWFPWFRQTVEDGRDVSPERGADLVLQLASGRYDELSGCFLYIEDDLDALVTRAEEIRRERLYSLALKKVR
jgi:NAD(P)-dependent dehydrogenase (short-subunit alcohol dehydrogenase family)